MDSERRRAARDLFATPIDLTNMQSEEYLAALTRDLNPFGCSVKTVNPFPEGTEVRLRISHSGSNFAAIGKVVYSRHNTGMRIAFIAIEARSQAILNSWLANLRNQALSD